MSSSRTVKFSDLLTRPVEFSPIESPPSPSSQLDTLSSTDSSSEEEEPAEETPVPPTVPEGSSPPTTTVPPDEASSESVPKGPEESSPPTTAMPADVSSEPVPEPPEVASSPVPTPPAGNSATVPKVPEGASPPTTAASNGSSAPVPMVPEGTSAPVTAPPGAEASPSAAAPASPETNSDRPTAPASQSQAESEGESQTSTSTPENQNASDAAPSRQGPETTQDLVTSPSSQQQSSDPAPVPPMPASSVPGSVFNIPGLQTAFPMRPTALAGVSLVTASEAEETARRLGLKTPNNFSVPSATRLPDGSVILAAPTAAVSMARVSASCSEALGSPTTRPLTEEVLGLIDKFRRAPEDDSIGSKLAEALRALHKSPMLSCDPSLESAVAEARSFFGKLHAAVGRKTSAELMYMKHAEEFRAMKRDLKALSDVVQADGQAVAVARDKMEALRKKHLPQAATSLFAVTSKLRQLRDLSDRLR
jgi:hypothetical protein